MATLTPPPTAPNPNDPKTFEANADAHLSWLALNVSEMNAFQAALTAIAAGTAFAIPYTFSTTTTDSDPGPGFLQLDNATQNAATTIRADLLGSDGSTWTNVIDTFDDSTSTVKGQIMLVKLGDATKWLAFNVTALASPAGYKNIAVTNVASSSANPFIDTDLIALQFTRTGDKGDTAVFTGGSLTSALNTSRATVASHATTAGIWGTSGNQIDWTGTAITTIFPNAPQAGAERVLICAGACSFTAGANMLIDGVTSGNTVTCAANDQVIVRAVSATQFKLSRVKYDGTAQVGGMSAVRSARTSNTILADGDNSKLIDVIAGTFIQTCTDAATLGNGWFSYYTNSGSGIVSMSFTTPAIQVSYGDLYLLQCNGSTITPTLINTGGDPYKYVTASDDIAAEVVAEYDGSGAVMPWNNVTSTSAGQVRGALANASGVTQGELESCVLTDGRIAIIGLDSNSYPAVQILTKYGVNTTYYTLENVVANGSYLAITATNNGGFVACWRRNSNSYPYFVGYNSSLAPLYSPILQYSAASDLVTCFDSPGTNEVYIVRRTTSQAIQVAKYNYSGALQGALTTLFTENIQANMVARQLSNGNFVLGYCSYPSYAVKISVYNSAFSLQASNTVETPTTNTSQIRLIALTGKFGIFYLKYDAPTVTARGCIYSNAAVAQTSVTDIAFGNGGTALNVLNVAWNGVNFASAYKGASTGYLSVFSDTLTQVSTSGNPSYWNNPTAMSVTARKDYITIAPASPATLQFYAFGITNIAGVTTNAITMGNTAKLKTKGLAPLTSKVTASIDFDHSAKTPAGCKGSLYNYSAIMN